MMAGRLPSSQVHADDDVVAFMDIRPANVGHLLVVPRVHKAGLEALDEQLGAKVFAVAHRLARALRASGVRCDGVNMLLADGAAAGQEVFHVHMHVLPRFAGDGFGLNVRWLSPDRAELDTAAALIRAGLDRLPI